MKILAGQALRVFKHCFITGDFSDDMNFRISIDVVTFSRWDFVNISFSRAVLFFQDGRLQMFLAHL